MTYEWTAWEEFEKNLDPYIDWALNGPGEDRIFRASDRKTRDGDNVLLTLPLGFLPTPAWSVFEGLEQIVVPVPAVNAAAGGEVKVQPPDVKKLPSGDDGDISTAIREDTIIAGVIDVGMPLGHRRLRFADGKTRILSAWQMVGNWDLKKQEEIPFGCEFYEDEINAALRNYSGGNLSGQLNEEAFHHRLGALNFNQISRQTSLAHRASHGAHVLDMVAGADPADADEFAERVRIIAVNAPSSAVFGASGTYLDSYMLHAIQRIVDVADGICDKMRDAGKDVPSKGFPIVINLSFGKHAGSKDTLDRFAAALEQFQVFRKDKCKSRIDIVMPTGNDNLARCNAFLEPEPGQHLSLGWRMQPQDQSSNFAEIWFRDEDQTTAKHKPAIAVSLTAPGSSSAPPAPPDLGKGESQVTKLKRNGVVVAHVYLTRVYERRRLRTERPNAKPPKPTDIKYRYTLCVIPTYRPEGSGSVARPGIWTITVENSASEVIQAVISVQTDQGLSPNRTINRRSYFDDDNYDTHAPDGRLLESYAYPKDKKGKYKNLDIQADTPVRRHGTMNASAAHKAVARVGGYRASDGRPAFYSSTGRGRPSGKDSGTKAYASGGKYTARAPTAALPTDDGPAHGGILSAGSVDGSRVVMRGTSFASSQAARLMIIELLAKRGENGVKSTIWWIANTAEAWAATIAPEELTYKEALIEVIGGGRIPAPQQRNPRRVTQGPFDG